MYWECIIIRGGENYNFLCAVVCNYTASAKHIKRTFAIAYCITPFTYFAVPVVFSLRNLFSGMIYSKSIILSLKYAQ